MADSYVIRELATLAEHNFLGSVLLARLNRLNVRWQPCPSSLLSDHRFCTTLVARAHFLCLSRPELGDELQVSKNWVQTSVLAVIYRQNPLRFPITSLSVKSKWQDGRSMVILLLLRKKGFATLLCPLNN